MTDNMTLSQLYAYNSRFEVGDRVIHKDWGPGTIRKRSRSALDSKLIWAYIMLFDEAPPVEYNMGQRLALVFPKDLEVER